MLFLLQRGHKEQILWSYYISITSPFYDIDQGCPASKPLGATPVGAVCHMSCTRENVGHWAMWTHPTLVLCMPAQAPWCTPLHWVSPHCCTMQMWFLPPPAALYVCMSTPPPPRSCTEHPHIAALHKCNLHCLHTAPIPTLVWGSDSLSAPCTVLDCPANCGEDRKHQPGEGGRAQRVVTRGMRSMAAVQEPRGCNLTPHSCIRTTGYQLESRDINEDSCNWLYFFTH